MRLALLAIACVAVSHQVSQAADSPATIRHLRCEWRVDPLGIGVARPRLSWEMADARRGAAQTAYQVLVASSPEKLARDEADLWDSGKVASNQSARVVYAGKPLASRMRCHWKVRIWDHEGKATADSEPALWTMGLLTPDDRKAKWIGLDGPMVHPGKGSQIDLTGCKWFWIDEAGVEAAKSAPQGSRFFRGTVTVPEGRTITEAKFLLSADDSFELFVDGKPAGRGTAWNQPTLATITNHLAPGENTLAIVVTNGAEGPAGLIGKLVVRLDEGEPIVQRIDTSWKAIDKSVPGWNTPKGDTSGWKGTVAAAGYGDKPWGELATAGIDVLGCPQFRKEFSAPAGVRRATVYASALGIYQLHINGRRVGEDYFTPGWTDYNDRVYYDTYDVTELVRADGPNAIGATLAAGWYAGAIGWKSERFHYGDRPKLWVQLELELEDGTRETVATDGTWKTGWGPYVEGEFLAGETYDARMEMPGWSAPGFDDSAWGAVAVTEEVPPVLEAHPGVPIRRTGTVKPVAVTEPKPGQYVFDLGQNFAGFVRLAVTGEPGTRVRMRHAEMLNPDGTIYTTNLRTARAADTYVCRGGGPEVFEPDFTFHGFRYVEVTGYPGGKPPLDAVTGIAINSDTPLVGSFECSSAMVNQLYSNIVWTQRANFISVPTDCPQRDERMGWTGDAEVFIRAATYNADVAAFFTKWLVDVEDSQREDGAVYVVCPQVVTDNAGVAAWSDCCVICPWVIYQVYGDTRVLAEHYDVMERWIAYCQANSEGLLRPAQGYGDWLSIGADTPKDVLATAYFAHSTDLVAKVAAALGKKDDAAKYRQLFEDIRAAFNKAYVAEDGRIKGNTQTCYVLALWFDLLSEENRDRAAQYLVEDIRARGTRLSTGFVGTSYLMPTLTQIGQTPLAYELLLTDAFPSWGFSIKQGATSIWERWDGWTPEKGFQTPGMNSFAHYSFGAVARWMFESVAGIGTAEPGFGRLAIHPHPAPGLDWVKARYDSLHGPIAVAWKQEDGRFALDVTVPANTTARIAVPAADGQEVLAPPDAKPVRSEPGARVYQVPAGSYQFVVQ